MSLNRHESRRFDGRRLLEPQFLDGLLADLVLLDLAGDGHGEAVDELDVAGRLEMRQLLAAEVADFVRRGRLARRGA